MSKTQTPAAAPHTTITVRDITGMTHYDVPVGPGQDEQDAAAAWLAESGDERCCIVRTETDEDGETYETTETIVADA